MCVFDRPVALCYLMFFSSDVRAFTTALKASSLPGATHLSGCSRTASFLYALFTSSLKSSHSQASATTPLQTTFDPPPLLLLSSPCCTGFHAQHVPGVFAVPDAADGVGLLFGEAHADLGHRALPSVLTHVSDGREEGLEMRTSTLGTVCVCVCVAPSQKHTWNISLMPSPLCADVSK